MLSTSLFFGMGSFTTLVGLGNTIKGGTNVYSPKAYGWVQSRKHANRKAEVVQITEHQGTLAQNLENNFNIEPYSILSI